MARRDKNQVELILEYKLKPQQRLEYEVEVFFFFPQHLGLAAAHYQRQHFYRDQRSLLRFGDPKYSYADLTQPLQKIRELLPKIDVHKRLIITWLRFFACAYAAYFFKRVRRRCKKLRVKRGQRLQQLDACIFLLSRARVLLRELGVLAAEIAAMPPSAAQAAIVGEVSRVREYCYRRWQESLVRVCVALDTDLPRELLVFSRWSAWYSRHHGYFQVTVASPREELERYAQRKRSLKKRINRVLHLELSGIRMFTLRKQIGYMVAAAAAGFWAFFANILIIEKLLQSRSLVASNLEDFLGVSGMLIVAAFTLAYVLKDRIKELGRSRFKHGLFGSLPDYSERAWAVNLSGKRQRVADIQEWMRFFSQSEYIEDEVLQIRRDRFSMVDGVEEQVLYYKKSLKPYSRFLSKLKLPLGSLRDILRFSIRRYLSKLDDPWQKSWQLGAKGELSRLALPKVYYIDVVVAYSYRQDKVVKRRFDYDTHRLVLNKKGLLRVEKI